MNQSPQNMPAQPGKNGQGFTKLEETALRLVEARIASGIVTGPEAIKHLIKKAAYTLKATNHFANNGSFDTFED